MTKTNEAAPSEALFLGTPEFAVPSLLELAGCALVRLQAVITQPDRPQGRGLKKQPVPIKEAAADLGITVHQPKSLAADQLQPLMELF